MDSWTGRVLETTETPENVSLQRPQWDASGAKVSVIYMTEKGEGIMSYCVKTMLWSTLIEAGSNDIQSSFIRNDSLFFISSYSGTDNIYLCTPEKSIIPVTNSKFGINDLNLNGSLLLFSDYSSQGNNICYTTLPLSYPEEEIHTNSSSYLIKRFENITVAPVISTDSVYSPVSYRKWQHLFRFHSWMPFYADIESIQDDPLSINPGFTVMTQNNLSSLVSYYGYEYSGNRHKFHTSINWLGWYPVFKTRFDFGNSPHIEKFSETVTDPANYMNGYELTNEISLPLNFRGDRFNKFLYLSVNSTFKNDHIFLKEKGIYDKGQNRFTGRLYFSMYYRSALRDIYPRWAQLFDFSYSSYPFDSDIYGDILTGRTILCSKKFNHDKNLCFLTELLSQEVIIMSSQKKLSLVR